MSQLIEVFGMQLPLIADLPNDHKLVAHKNGPCIATEHSLWALEFVAGEPPDGEDSDLSHEVRRAAVTEYVKWTWPLVRETVFPTEEAAV